MKITKQRLKEIIKEELEFVGAEIDKFAEPEVEDDSSHVAELLGTPEGTMIAKIMARKIIDQFASFPELADAIDGLDRDEVTARVVAAMRDNALYDPMEGSDEMELEEAAPWDKEALKRSYPGDGNAHAVIDREHDYGTERHKVVDKLRRVGGDPSKSPYPRSR
jgi:hypothetical protein